MKLLIAAVGKAKPSPEQQLFIDYTKRIPWKIALKEVESKQADLGKRKAREAELLLAACEGHTHMIALDETGKNLNSRELAATIATWQKNGVSSLVCVIGGADGLHDSVLNRAQLVLSFGRLTWPHMLVRALLAEQLYRTHSIISGHPYHRG